MIAIPNEMGVYAELNGLVKLAIAYLSNTLLCMTLCS